MARNRIVVGMIGCGTVGTGVLRLLREQADLYRYRLGRAVDLRRVLVRDARRSRAPEIDASLLTDDADAFFATPDMSVVVEVAGGRGVVGDHVRRALAADMHVVTANKVLLAEEGPSLFELARGRGVAIAFEASCGGGIPIVTALQFGLMANQMAALFGILNGTCNYILTQMTRAGETYASALAAAQANGYAEADPEMDVSGRDAAQKLAVLASLAFGVSASADDVACEGIDQLDLADIRFGAELGYDIKLLAIAERAAGRDGMLSLRVHPAFVHRECSLAQVRGPFNALSVYGHATGHTMYYGRGAGQMPTAGAVVSDLINVASGWYPGAFAELNLWGDGHTPARLVDRDELLSRFYLRFSARDVPGVMAQLSGILGRAGISLSALLQHESAVGQFVPVVIITHEARQGSVLEALTAIEKLDVISGRPVCIRIVDLPEE